MSITHRLVYLMVSLAYVFACFGVWSIIVYMMLAVAYAVLAASRKKD